MSSKCQSCCCSVGIVKTQKLEPACDSTTVCKDNIKNGLQVNNLDSIAIIIIYLLLVIVHKVILQLLSLMHDGTFPRTITAANLASFVYFNFLCIILLVSCMLLQFLPSSFFVKW